MNTGPAAVLAGAPPLIETKLLPPRGRPELVARPRLLRRLDELSSTALTLVDAPVGFGKTVLAQSWCAQSDSAIAWISIDQADDDAVRFWTYVATGVDRVRSGLGRAALTRLRTAAVAAETAVDELLNGIAAFGRPLVLVLDDLHALKSDACVRTFEHAVERLPAHARIVATTRSDPAIGLGGLRARGSLGEIRARDLAFTFDEARELIVEHERIPLTDDDLELLLDRTEGWPAGLYLAALWLRTLDDPTSGVRDFHGDHRHVADYLTGEVLDTLDAETRDFLLRTSVLGRFSGAMCDATLGRKGSAALIAELERSNVFLIALDPQGEWYRYHHLFRELLQLELALLDQPAIARLHRAASEWCRDHGLIEDALEHAQAAGDEASVAELLVQNHLALMRTGRQATLLGWIRKLSSDRLLDHPILASTGALAAGLLGQDAEARRRFVGLAYDSRARRPELWTPYHEVGLGLAQTTWVDGDLGEAVAAGRRMVEAARAIEDLAVPALSSLAFLLVLAGDLDDARTIAQEAVDRPEAPTRPHGYVYALATLSLLDSEDGYAGTAESTARKALSAAGVAGIAETASGGAAHVALARALVPAGKMPEAESEAVFGERLRRQPGPEACHVHALLVLAEIRALRGRLARANEDLAQARASLEALSSVELLHERAERVQRAIEAAQADTVPLAEMPSAAELSVLRLLATDLSQREIGAELYLSVNTIKTHTRALYRKLGAASREEAVARANALELLDTIESPG